MFEDVYEGCENVRFVLLEVFKCGWVLIVFCDGLKFW